MTDRIADVHGERTPHAKGTVWPARVDLHLVDGRYPARLHHAPSAVEVSPAGRSLSERRALKHDPSAPLVTQDVNTASRPVPRSTPPEPATTQPAQGHHRRDSTLRTAVIAS